MSRIGKKPVVIPANVTVNVAEGNVVTVKGPKGELTNTFHADMILSVEGNVCWYFPSITAPAFSRLHRLNSRLTARLPPPALNFFSASAGC